MLRVTGQGQRQDPSPVQRPAPYLSSLLPRGPSLLLGQEPKGSESTGEPGAMEAGSPAVVGRGLGGAASAAGRWQGGGEQPDAAAPPARLSAPAQGQEKG